MKTSLLSLTLITLFSSSVMANSGMSIKDIRTVEDVQDIRNKIIFRMTEVLNTENLSEDKVMILKKRIELLSNKPLPTQEQIDWRVENPLDFHSLKQKKDQLKRDLRIKIFRHFRNNRQLANIFTKEQMNIYKLFQEEQRDEIKEQLIERKNS